MTAHATNSRAAAYISTTLYHFLPNSFEIFESIMKRGFLCSVGNKGRLDRFRVALRENGIADFDVWQNPRVCLTDIPREHLSVHAERYGRFALGFSRNTILDWGGGPVWYMNNHVSSAFGGNAILYQLLRFSVLVDHTMTLVRCKEQKLFISGKLIEGDEAANYINGAMSSLYQMLSFVKEMSSRDYDDQRYLGEREWRIVASKGEEFRPLRAEEREELVKQNPAWGCPPDTTDPDILDRFGSSPMIDQFVFFQGIPRSQTVSQGIEIILVPDEQMRDCVTRFIAEHPEAFRSDGPNVEVFPG